MASDRQVEAALDAWMAQAAAFLFNQTQGVENSVEPWADRKERLRPWMRAALAAAEAEAEPRRIVAMAPVPGYPGIMEPETLIAFDSGELWGLSAIHGVWRRVALPAPKETPDA